jgi:hypothetical protein
MNVSECRSPVEVITDPRMSGSDWERSPTTLPLSGVITDRLAFSLGLQWSRIWRTKETIEGYVLSMATSKANTAEAASKESISTLALKKPFRDG